MSSRTDALRRLEDFLDLVPAYDRERSYDRPGHGGVSRLSQWIRHRVITEEECVRTVLTRYSLTVAEKFIQEILWRTYWKGWLELRPQVWHSYLGESEILGRARLDDSRYRAACEGRTQLPFFNDWVDELRSTGYLHNHTRMWFASVWIFTFQLPWQLGAALMFAHLLDADPASNTLSWRWVAGLHTPGKRYLACPDNIAKFSEGRWRPDAHQLVADPKPVMSDLPAEIVPLPEVSSAPPHAESIVLMHDDDLSIDLSAELGKNDLSYAVLDRKTAEQSDLVYQHRIALRRDAAHRSGAPLISNTEQLVALADRRGATRVHSFLPSVGYERALLMQLANELAPRGIQLVWHRRAWDARYQPIARAGFFPFWQKVRQSLSSD